MKYLRKTLSVDPGFNTGWAFWNGTSSPITGCMTSKMNNPISVIGDLSQQFCQLVGSTKPVKIILEDQWFSEHSITSLVSSKTGAQKKLDWLTGAYISNSYRLNIPVEMVLPMMWKGNLNDEAVKKRVERILGIYYRNSHIADAVGIGLNAANGFIKIGVKNE